MSRSRFRLSGSIRALLIAATVLLAVVFTSSSRLIAGDAPPPQSVTGPTSIGSLGGSYTRAAAMNAFGQIVGYSSPVCDCTQNAFSWTQAGGMIDLGALLPGANQSQAMAVSNAGQVVGIFYMNSGSAGFSWTVEHGMTVLPTFQPPIDGTVEPGDTSNVNVVGVNNSGAVIGFVQASRNSSQYVTRSFVWTRETGMTVLGTLGGNDTYAEQINELGQVAGQAQIASGEYHAFTWTAASGITDPGATATVTLGFGVRGINESGEMAGYAGHGQSGFSYSPSTGMVDLPTLGGPSLTQANGINERGEVFGYSHIAGGGGSDYHAVLWPLSGGVIDLGHFGSGFSIANRMNERGQVVGHSYTPGFADQRAFLWTATDGLVDLGASQADAIAITNTGLIAGHVANQAVIWQTTPAPDADEAAPTASITSPTATTYIGGTVVTASYTCADTGGSGLVSCAGPVPSGTATDTLYPGVHRFNVTATDRAGNFSITTVQYGATDVVGPSISIGSPLNGSAFLSHTTAPLASYSCSDVGGLATCAGADELGIPAPNGAAVPFTVGSHTLTVTATDMAGNQALQSVSYTVAQGPAATITAPASRATYQIGQSVTVDFACIAGLGVASCTSDQANSSVLDTSTPGVRSFTVTVTDTAGNTASATTHYMILAPAMPAGPALTAPPPGGFIGPISIGTFGGDYSQINAMSKNGYAIGNAYSADNAHWHAFFWSQTGGMVDIGGFGGWTDPSAVSVTGQVVGSAWVPGHYNLTHAFSWTAAGGMVDLGAPAFPIHGEIRPTDTFRSRAFDVNASGMVIGYVEGRRENGPPGFPPGMFYESVYRGFVWTPASGMVFLPTLGHENIQPEDVNDSGMVVGWAQDANFAARAFAWTQAGGIVDLGTLGGNSSSASRVNSSGVVTGRADTAAGDTHAFRWTAPGGMLDLGGTEFSEGLAVNDSGQIVGYRYLSTQPFGFSWSATGAIDVLPHFGGGFSYAGGVNASGQVIGYSYTAGFAEQHAFLWTSAGGMVDLGLATINAISDNHLGGGHAVQPNGLTHAVIWVLPGFTPDTTAPVITITTPANGTTYTVGESVTAGYACADAGAGIASCVGTSPNGSSINTSATGTFLFTVTAFDGNGNRSTSTSSYTVGAAPPASSTGHMRGDGWLAGGGGSNPDKLRFKFNVVERANGTEAMRFHFWTLDRDDRPRKTNVFDAVAITSIQFSDDPGFAPGNRPRPTIDSVTFSGTGEFNDAPGFTFTVTATDRGEPGKNSDTFALTVKNGAGATVYSTSGTLVGGNIQSLRLAGRRNTDPSPDTTAPTIRLSKPDDTKYKVGQVVKANYSCVDRESGVGSCTGTVADGASINTSTAGTFTFTVTATDNAGNTSTRSVAYTVKPK